MRMRSLTRGSCDLPGIEMAFPSPWLSYVAAPPESSGNETTPGGVA